jgi:RND family efflux transporter MFP subunit
MKRTILSLISLSVIMLIVMTGCGKRNPKAAMTKTRSVEKAIPVMVERIVPADLEEYISFTAKLEGITDIYLMSESSGKVLAIDKHLGDWVDKGETIGRIENDSYLNQLTQAEANLLAAAAGLEVAAMSMEASQKLFEDNKISRSEFISAQSSHKQALAGHESAQALLKQSQLAVRNAQFTAPVSGYISDLKLEIGAYIGMGQQVCRLVDNSRLIIKTGLGESDVSGIKQGQKVYITKDGYEKGLDGIVSGIGIAPVNGSSSYPIEIELDNPDQALLPGMVVSGRVLRKTYEKVLFTSINNLTQVYDEYLVYIINNENRAEYRRVKIGRQIERNVIIVSGIVSGELLVVEGANSLSDNALVEIKK